MKAFTKISLIISGALAALGIMLCMVAACMGFGRVQMLGMIEAGGLAIGSEDFWIFRGYHRVSSDSLAAKWVDEEISFLPEEIENLDVDFGFGVVKIEESDSGRIEVATNYRSLWGKYFRRITCVQKGSTLKVSDDTDGHIFRMTYGSSDAELTIRLPAGCAFSKIGMEIGASDMVMEAPLVAEEAELVIGVGTLSGQRAEGLIEAKKLNLEVGSGKAKLSGIKVGELTAICGVGTLNLGAVEMQEGELECGVGGLTVEVLGREEDFDYDISGGMGDVQLGGSNFSGLGYSKAINNGAGKEIKIDCGVGEVEVSFREEP